MSEKKRGDHDHPPSTICCSFDQEREDSFNRSELTLWPEPERSSDGDDNGENNMDECVHELRPSADADDILKELAADPIFNKSPLDISERPVCPPRASEGQSSQHTSELRLQIAQQQEQLDALTSKLNTCQVEHGALKAENNQLVDELSAFRSKGGGEAQHPTTASDLGESSARLLVADDDGLLDKIASLTKDNARLHTMVSVMRKSLQTYIRDSRMREGKDGETIEGLRRENEALRRGGSGGGGEPSRVEELPSRGPSGEEVPNSSSSGRGSGREHIVPSTVGASTTKVNLKASFATDKTSMETLESSRRSMETLESSQRSSPTIYEELGRASSYRRCRDNNKDRVAKILERGAAANRQSRRASICGVPSKLPTATLADEQQPRMTFRNVVDRGEELLGGFRRHVSERWSSLPNEDLSTASSSEGEEVRGGGEGLLVDFR